MKKLIDFPDDEIFYSGTIVVMKGSHETLQGTVDKKYAIICQFAGFGNLQMLDLYRSIGGLIGHDLKENVEGHAGVNKQGIKQWCKEYFESYYTKEGQDEWIPKLDDIIYIEYLSDYFDQCNRDIKV